MKIKGIILTVSAVLLVGAGCLLTINHINNSKNNNKITDDSAAYNEAESEITVTEEEYIPPVFIECSEKDIHKGKLILVNRDYEYVRNSNSDITNIYAAKSKVYEVNTIDMMLDRTMIGAINSMLEDFSKETGINDILANSGYRSYNEQKIMYDNDLEATGKAYSELVAPPGNSEHHTGLAMDFAINDGYSFPALKNEGEYSWIYENANKYGMILRYTEENKHITGYMAESWHFRYVGELHATLIRKMGLAYEEYVNFLKDYSFESLLEYKLSDDELYSIYYVHADFETGKTDVPITYEAYKNSGDWYTISGNNVDGYIVTLKVSELSEDYDESFLYMFRPIETGTSSEASSEETESDDEENEENESEETESPENDEETPEEAASEDEGW